jgi:hypothetical protein
MQQKEQDLTKMPRKYFENKRTVAKTTVGVCGCGCVGVGVWVGVGVCVRACVRACVCVEEVNRLHNEPRLHFLKTLYS